MKIVKVTETNLQEILSRAASILKKGGVIVGPSDTVYGLYADATNEGAVKKIFKIKKRVPEKAFPIFVKDIATARKLAYIDDRKARFLEKIWPGAVTVVFHNKGKLPKILTGSLDTIALRIPDNTFLFELLGRVNFPLAQTSANISGSQPTLSTNEALAIWKKEKSINLVVDGGELPKEPSTVADFTKDQPIILRSGVITKKELDSMLGG